jgi:flagellar basal body-associated protein FliL
MTLGLIVLLSAVAVLALIGGFFFSMLVISKRSSEAASEAFNEAFDVYTSKEKQ